MIQRMLYLDLWFFCLSKGIHRRKVFLSLFPERQMILLRAEDYPLAQQHLSWIGALGSFEICSQTSISSKSTADSLYSCELSDCFLMNRIWQSVIAWHSRWRCKRGTMASSQTLLDYSLGDGGCHVERILKQPCGEAHLVKNWGLASSHRESLLRVDLPAFS